METVKGVVLAVLMVIFLRIFVIDLVQVSGISMEPSLPTNSLVLVNKISYGIQFPRSGKYLFQWRTPKPEDILLVSDPRRSTLAVKRCARTTSYGVFVTGDNPPYSVDSRIYGSLPIERVHGKVVFFISKRKQQ